MSAGDLAVTLAALLCAFGFTALIVVLMRVLDTLKALRVEVESLRRETGPLLVDLRESTDEARDRVLGSAEAISEAVEGSSRLARRAFSVPVIKAAGIATGTSRTVRRLRRRDASTELVAVATQRRRRA